MTNKHTSQHASVERITNFQEAIDSFHNSGRLLKALFESAESETVSTDTAKSVFAGFLGEGEKMATRSANQVDALTNLFVRGAGNNGRSGADLLSAVTDYYTHESSGNRGVMAQFTSSEVGSAAKSKVEFFDAVSSRILTPTDRNGKTVEIQTGWNMSRNRINSLASLGEMSLSLSN